MILLNNKLIEPTRFPDGTYATRCNLLGHMFDPENRITWKYDSDDECIQLWYLVHQLRALCLADTRYLRLFMPYIPNARMDRTKNFDDIFTLKWFADFINALAFDEVNVHDPHSSVSVALLNQVRVHDAKPQIQSVLKQLSDIGKTDVLLCYPDEGAAKRYADLMKMDYVFGIKHRDWHTGNIQNLELTTPEKIAGKDVLIVDDICSRGGTFTFTARELKAAGAKSVYLYVTHCENTIHQGSILNDGLIEHVFTTDSIYRGDSDMITVEKEVWLYD